MVFNPFATKPPVQANYWQTARMPIPLSPRRKYPTIVAERRIIGTNGWEAFCAGYLPYLPLIVLLT